MTWAVDRSAGSAAEFHARTVPAPTPRQVWIFQAVEPALVLGSTQSEAVVDAEACRRAGVDVVRRRSGGGAVLLVPGEVVWIDVVLPAGDPVWDDDVGRAAHWLGDVWVRALAATGVAGGVVHRSGLERRPWSDLVCFAGLGPGEVTVEGRKVVGISQRRTRQGARFQCAVPLVWDPAALVVLLSPPRPTEADLAAVAAGVPSSPAVLTSAFVDALPA